MTLRIYNTLTRKKEEFAPLNEGKVGMYVCGPTVYDSAHLGHARAALVFDVVFRHLRKVGYDVTYVRNYTDVDDKIIARANEREISTGELSQMYIDEYDRDMKDLGLLDPTHTPRVTEHMGDIIAIIEALIEKGHAYDVDGDVFYAVKSFDGYGKLSGRDLESLEAGSRVEVDLRKRNPMDFALWKSSKPGEPSWDSPWGAGRPGWHIECSAMSTHYIGKTLDIHGGGKDLMFPHHENEVAQSEAANGVQYARFWMHNGFVNIEAEKMSKSLGNFLTIREILGEYHPEAVRLFLLTNHFRSPIDYTTKNMEEATGNLKRVYASLADADALPGEADFEAARADFPEDAEEIASFESRYLQAMNDDFNTALALAHVFDLVRTINRMRDEHQKSGGAPAAAAAKAGAVAIRAISDNLGLFGADPTEALEQIESRLAKKADMDAGAIDALIDERTQARADKNWARADEIRDQLDAAGVEIKDGPEGTAWSYK